MIEATTTTTSRDRRGLWGEVTSRRLGHDDELITLCHRIKPVAVDQPSLAILLDHSAPTQSSLDSQPADNNQASSSSSSTTNLKIRPNIDSYIINTIKLNQLLRNRITFEQVDSFFARSNAQNNNKQSNRTVKSSQPRVESDQDARHYMRQFIVILCLHSGFNNASSIALNILVDVLDHFIDSFCRLFKNLRQIHQFSLTDNQTSSPLSFTNDFYSSQDFVQQALEESGVGSIKELKEFYVNDIVAYYRQTYRKVAKLYEEYKAKKRHRTTSGSASRFGAGGNGDLSRVSGSVLDFNDKITNLGDEELPIDDFMSHNDFLNEESNSVLGEILTGLANTNFDEEMNKLLQMIGTDPFVAPHGNEFLAPSDPHI